RCPTSAANWVSTTWASSSPSTPVDPRLKLKLHAPERSSAVVAAAPAALRRTTVRIRLPFARARLSFPHPIGWTDRVVRSLEAAIAEKSGGDTPRLRRPRRDGAAGSPRPEQCA